MDRTELQVMANQYLDGELDKGKEAVLFNALAEDEDLRNYFKDLNAIKSAVQDNVEEFPDYLEERIFYSMDKKTEQNLFHTLFNKNLFAVLSYSVAVILIIVSVLFYSQVNEYKQKYEAKAEQVSQQNKMINLLYNSLPVTEITSVPDNQVVVRAKM